MLELEQPRRALVEGKFGAFCKTVSRSKYVLCVAQPKRSVVMAWHRPERSCGGATTLRRAVVSTPYQHTGYANKQAGHTQST